MLWGDTHHPALSETAGDYDGQFLFIGDKANSRVAVVDLRDFETKQIVKNPISNIDHGGMFVTPGARAQLLKFFEAWGMTDEATLSARRKLSSLLFS